MWFPGTPALKRPDMYLYDQSRLQGNTGTHHTASTAFGFQRNVWYDIRMFIILNTLSSNGNANANGKAVLYVNGVAAVCRDGLKFRGNGSTNKGKIGRLAFHVYHGGAAGPDEFPSPGTSSFVDFDNFSYTRQSTTGVSRTC